MMSERRETLFGTPWTLKVKDDSNFIRESRFETS